MRQLIVAVLALFAVTAAPLASAQAEHRLYLAQILSDAPRFVYALGPCPAPLECSQAAGVDHP